MPIYWDKRRKRWRFEFDRYIEGRRQRATKLLPRGWSQAQADAYERAQGGRLYALASGVEQDDPLIETAVALYLRDKAEHLKSFKTAAEHLAAIAWAYMGKPMSDLSKVADAIREHNGSERVGTLSPATVKQRLALLKAACRWGWKRHKLTKHDPTTEMYLPPVRNERHAYRGRGDMLRICRACTNWQAQIAIRVAYYSGMRLGELLQAVPDGDVFVLLDTKNGAPRSVPIHPKVRHLARFFPLPGPKITIQRAWERARDATGYAGTRFHDLRHWAASSMVNAGVSLYEVGAVLGHRDSRSTARYSHLDSSSLAKAVNKIGRKSA